MSAMSRRQPQKSMNSPATAVSAGRGGGSAEWLNISGAGVTLASKQPDLAKQLLEWLSGPEAQQAFAQLNQEFPVNPDTQPSELLKHWGPFKGDDVPVVEAGRLQAEAIRLMDRAGYR